MDLCSAVWGPSILLSAEASIRKSLPHYPFQGIQDEHLTAVVVSQWWWWGGGRGALQQHQKTRAASVREVLTERCAEVNRSATLHSPDWVLIAASARTRALPRVWPQVLADTLTSILDLAGLRFSPCSRLTSAQPEIAAVTPSELIRHRSKAERCKLCCH